MKDSISVMTSLVAKRVRFPQVLLQRLNPSASRRPSKCLTRLQADANSASLCIMPRFGDHLLQHNDIRFQPANDFSKVFWRMRMVPRIGVRHESTQIVDVARHNSKRLCCMICPWIRERTVGSNPRIALPKAVNTLTIERNVSVFTTPG